MATTGLMLSGIAFFFGGVAFGNTEYMVPVFTGGAGMIAVLLMAPAMFVGFDVIPQSAEEMKIPLNQIASILVLSIIMAAGWYVIMIVGIGLSAPPSVREAASVPVADAMAYAYGSPVFGQLLILGAVCGILSSWNGFIPHEWLMILGWALIGVVLALLAKYSYPNAAKSPHRPGSLCRL
jgi:basic amino acid/polyamine antiporter, APA family